MYLYIVSSGEYSDYDLTFFALHERKFTEEEMKSIIEELKKNYIAKGYPTEDYHVEDSKIEEEFLAILRNKGFRIGYAVGEFHLLSYSKMDDLRAEIPWMARDKEPSMLRIGL